MTLHVYRTPMEKHKGQREHLHSVVVSLRNMFGDNVILKWKAERDRQQRKSQQNSKPETTKKLVRYKWLWWQGEAGGRDEGTREQQCGGGKFNNKSDPIA